MNTLDTIGLFILNVLVPNVWPLCFLLIALMVLRQVRDELRPLAGRVISGLGNVAQSNAVVISIALGYALSASFSAFTEVFRSLDSDAFHSMSVHQYLVAWCKVMNPFVVTFLARITLTNQTLVSSSLSKPPFPPNPPVQP